MQTVRVAIEQFSDRLAKGDCFTFARYGDGEWNAIKGKRGTNCDKHEYYKPMGKRLRDSLDRPITDKRFMYAFQTQTDLLQRADVQQKIRSMYSVPAIYDADVFHVASEAGTLYPLIRQLRTMHTCVIGPAKLRELRNGVFVYQGFIEIPPQNCFLQLEHIEKQVLKYSRLSSDHGVVYCFSASMATEVMLYDLFKNLGQKNWMIDFGSLWDVYVGQNSRKYHSRVTAETINRNLGKQ